MPAKIFNGFFVLFILNPLLLFSQENLNQLDAEGKRHGKWMKKFEGTDQIRYEGEFNHGKEVGTFKFYEKGNEDHPHATKTYSSNSDIVDAKFYTKKGKLLTEGHFKDRKRTGKWTYYHKKKEVVMMIENYQNGKLNGEKSIFYENGKISEKQHYLNGVQQGEHLVYGANGKLLQYYTYKDGQLQGRSKIYNTEGQLIKEGNYKNGLRDGIWKNYENGKLTETEKFPKEKPSVSKGK